MMPEQGALVEKARESIRAARVLTSEGLHDFAASRAYHAMFYLAEALLLGGGMAFSRHSAVIAEFGRHFVKGGRMDALFYAHLREAQDQRNRGDYGTGDPRTEGESREQIRRAEEFLDASLHLLRGSSRS